MFKIVTRLVCLVTTAFALACVAWSGVAFAQVPPPEPPQVQPVSGTSASGSSFASDLGWMLIGAGVLLAIAVLVTVTVVAFQRHHESTSGLGGAPIRTA